MCPEKSNFSVKLPEKNRNFSQIFLENRNFWEIDKKRNSSEIFFEKPKFWGKLPEKN